MNKKKAMKKKWVVPAIIAGSVVLVAVVAVAVFLAVQANVDDSESGTVAFDEQDTPVVGGAFTGTYAGSGAVYLWVEGVNHAVPTTSDDGVWQYTYRGGLTGGKAISVAVVHADAWGQKATMNFDFSLPAVEDNLVTDGWGKTTRTIFQPVEKSLRAGISIITSAVQTVGAYITGSGSGDLDDDGVPDHWQGGAAAPSSFASFPYMTLILAITALVALVVLVYAIRAKAINSVVERGLMNQHARKLQEAGAEQQFKVQELAAKKEVAVIKGRVLEKKLAVVGGLKGKQLAAQERLASKKLDAVVKLRNGAVQAVPEVEPVKKSPFARLRGKFRRGGA